MVGFTFAAYNTTGHRRIRYPAHKASRAYIEKYNLAYARMRALPPDDPRSLAGQAKIHCAFCNRAYMQGGEDGGSNVPLQIHFSWLFLPWHRWYLFFHERILGSLIGDPTFALPYWNWDDQVYGGNVLPEMFNESDTYPWLYDINRDLRTLPPNLATLAKIVVPGEIADDKIVDDNNSAMCNSLYKITAQELFLGQAPLLE